MEARNEEDEDFSGSELLHGNQHETLNLPQFGGGTGYNLLESLQPQFDIGDCESTP